MGTSRTECRRHGLESRFYLTSMMRLSFSVAVLVVCVFGVESKAVDDHKHARNKRSAVCYERVGCFNDGAPFFSLQRPLNLLPQSPDTVQTKYWLYTRESPKTESVLDARYPGNFTTVWKNYKTRPTKIVVHGFLDNINIFPWPKEMKDELLTSGDYNVIIVDWHKGNQLPYTQATGNTRLVGAQLADLIVTIQVNNRQPSSDFHIIGHSLGAHIGGYTGERIPGLGRISGLDPAGPYFDNTEPAVRLDPTDAVFVDVIHSDGESLINLGYGMGQPVGHADYYPNNGKDQPGCASSLGTKLTDFGLVQGTQEFVACDHLRSFKYFTESINSKCPFLAFPCASEEDFTAGKCNSCSPDTCGKMGFHADSTIPKNRTIYFLNTGETKPFCQYHMYLTVHVHSGIKDELGQMKVKLTGNNGTTDWITMNETPIDYQPGGKYTYTLAVPSVGHVTSLEFGWHHVTSLSDPANWNLFGMRHPTLQIDDVTIRHHETGELVRFCVDDAPVETDQTISVVKKC